MNFIQFQKGSCVSLLQQNHCKRLLVLYIAWSKLQKFWYLLFECLGTIFFGLASQVCRKAHFEMKVCCPLVARLFFVKSLVYIRCFMNSPVTPESSGILKRIFHLWKVKLHFNIVCSIRIINWTRDYQLVEWIWFHLAPVTLPDFNQATS